MVRPHRDLEWQRAASRAALLEKMPSHLVFWKVTLTLANFADIYDVPAADVRLRRASLASFCPVHLAAWRLKSTKCVMFF